MKPQLDVQKLSSMRYLKVGEVAELIGVHPRTVWRLVSSGDLPEPIRIGPKIVRWRLADLATHLADLSR
jgi:excisionase family DNA binding protein